MVGFIAIAFGGTIAIMIISLGVSKLAFKETPPTERALYISVISWLIASIIAGFGMADGGPFRFEATVYYIPGAVIAFFLLQNSYKKQWVEEE